MKKFKLLCLCAAGAAAICTLACSCGKDKLEKYAENMRKAADSITVVDAKITLSDQDVVVYTLDRHIEIDLSTHTASVADSKTTLSENFETTTTSTTVAVENVSGSSLIGLKLKESYVTQYQITDGDLIATVAKDKIDDVLSHDITASTDMTLKVDFEAGKLVGAEYSYVNASSRTVNVVITYA